MVSEKAKKVPQKKSPAAPMKKTVLSPLKKSVVAPKKKSDSAPNKSLVEEKKSVAKEIPSIKVTPKVQTAEGWKRSIGALKKEPKKSMD
jgi:hypothetical protein